MTYIVRRIRSTHPYGFRSGEWAAVHGIVPVPGFPEGNRDCWLVEFPDGATDFWAVCAGESFGYEFRYEVVS